MDLYFAANMVSNKLYLNKGDLTFKDATKIARVDGQGHWYTGVAVVDINTDGWPDLYVSAFFRNDTERRTNLLYINQGPDENGNLVFEEAADRYGLADDGFSTQAYFFDYDLDGDLDLFVGGRVVSAGDFDNDGDTDYVAGNLENKGNGIRPAHPAFQFLPGCSQRSRHQPVLRRHSLYAGYRERTVRRFCHRSIFPGPAADAGGIDNVRIIAALLT
ncbi:MAG: VCBS repeat-containing protein [Lewinella sp.]|nr:VCBS repeat-containing protein [Lewinella sp.]